MRASLVAMIAAGSLCLAAPARADDDNHGSVTQDRVITSMRAVYAGMTLEEMGSGVVVFVDIPEAIDHLTIAPGEEPQTVASRLAHNGVHVVVLKLLRSLSPMLWICEDDCQRSVSFPDKDLQIDLVRYDDQRIEGHIATRPPQGKKLATLAADLHFALDLHNAAQARQRNGVNAEHEVIGGPPASAPPAFPAGAAGALYDEGKVFAYVDSVAFPAPAEFGGDARNRGRPVIVFTDAPMNRDAITTARDPFAAIRDQADAGRFKRYAVLRLLADHKAYVELLGDEPIYRAIADPTEALTVSREDARRVEGSYLCQDDGEKTKPGHLCLDLRFALDLKKPK